MPQEQIATATAYSLDLRQKILQAIERGAGSQRQIAAFFGVSLSFVEKLLIRLRHTGQAAAKKQGGHGRPVWIRPLARKYGNGCKSGRI